MSLSANYLKLKRLSASPAIGQPPNPPLHGQSVTQQARDIFMNACQTSQSLCSTATPLQDPHCVAASACRYCAGKRRRGHWQDAARVQHFCRRPLGNRHAMVFLDSQVHQLWSPLLGICIPVWICVATSIVLLRTICPDPPALPFAGRLALSRATVGII